MPKSDKGLFLPREVNRPKILIFLSLTKMLIRTLTLILKVMMMTLKTILTKIQRLVKKKAPLTSAPMTILRKKTPTVKVYEVWTDSK
jgi:hypothetical protein